MEENSRSIIGWDLGGVRPLDLPVDTPAEILLAHACPDLWAPSFPDITTLTIWGLHPLLKVIVTFHRRLRLDFFWGDGESGPLTPEPATNVQGTIVAWPLVKTGNPNQPYRRLTNPLPAAIFLAGGVLDDGCELGCGLQGVEFEITAQTTGPEGNDYEVVSSIQAKQAFPLGCRQLATDLCAQLEIKHGKEIVFVPSAG